MDVSGKIYGGLSYFSTAKIYGLLWLSISLLFMALPLTLPNHVFLSAVALEVNVLVLTSLHDLDDDLLWLGMFTCTYSISTYPLSILSQNVLHPLLQL